MPPSSSITRAASSAMPMPMPRSALGERGPSASAPRGLTTRLTSTDGQVVLIVRGEVDPATSDTFFRAIEAAFLRAPTVVVDLQGVTFMDSSGVNALATSFRDHDHGTGALVLRAPGPFIGRLLAITGLDQILTIQRTAPHLEPT